MELDNINAEINEELSRAVPADDVDATLSQAARLANLRERAAVIAARDAAPMKVEVVAAKPVSLGDELASTGIRTASTGSTFEVAGRDIFTDPFGGMGSQPSAPADYTPGINALPTLPTSLLDLLPAVPTSSDSVTYYKQVGFADATSATGVLQPLSQSEVEWVKVTVPVTKLGHSIVVAEETLADDAAVSALLAREGVRGVREAVEQFAIADLVAGAQEMSIGQQGIEVAIRQAKTMAELAGLPADVVVVTPFVREQIDTDALEFKGGPGIYGSGPASLFGMRIVTSYRLQGVPFLVGSTQGCRLRPRTGIEVASSTSHDGLFLKDGVAIKVRQRVALENTRPEAWVKGVFAGPNEPEGPEGPEGDSPAE